MIPAFGISNIGNTAGTSGTQPMGTYILAGSNITLSQSTGSNGVHTLTISAGAGGAADTVSVYEPAMRGATTTQSLANGTWYFQPVMISKNVSAYQLIMMQQMTTQSATTWSVTASISNASSTSGSVSYGVSGTMGLFSRFSTGTNANSSRLISIYSMTTSYSIGMSYSNSWNANVSSATASLSTAAALGFLGNIDSAGGATTTSTTSSGSTSFSSTSTAQQSFSTSFSNTFASQHLSGVRPNYIPFNLSIPPGEYWVGIRQSTTTGTTNDSRLTRIISMNPPGILAYTSNTQGFAELGVSNSYATSNLTRGWGSGNMDSVTSTTFGMDSISNMSNMQSYFQMVAKTN